MSIAPGTSTIILWIRALAQWEQHAPRWEQQIFEEEQDYQMNFYDKELQKIIRALEDNDA